MSDMQDSQNAPGGDYDDHEPGDVNGNIDPAFARKQKQQTRNQQQRRDGRPPRPQRQPRPAQPPGALAEGGDGSSAPTVSFAPPEPQTTRASNDVGNDAGQSTHGSDAGAGAAVAGVEGETRSNANGEPHGQQRARGPRRNRRGGRGRNNHAQGDRAPRDATGVPSAEGVSAEPVGTDMAADASNYDGDEAERPNPNPGAFGDPSRPMDRSARRNRNRRDKRDPSNVRGSGRGAPRSPQFAAPQFDADGNPLPVPEGMEHSALPSGRSGLGDDGERDGERLHKVLAQQGLGSRRDMEALIEAGEVEVNGFKAHVGQVVNEKDRVHVKRRKVAVKLGDDKPRILIYHKQAGEIVSRDDPEQRDTVFDRLPKPDHGKWVAVGRLDYNSEGLLLFTTYGELANRFMHPRYEILREYSVRVLGELTPEQEDQLMDGIELEDGPARVLSLDRIDRDSDAANHWYRLTLNEGRNREVRRMFEHLGLTVSRLIRISYGCVQMPSWLKRGQFKQLDEAETFNVLESVGLRSKKKLEKAARFGGRNKLPQQPLGPMRSATEHEAIWTGIPADAAGVQGRGRRQSGRNAGPGANGRQGGRFNSGNGGNRNRNGAAGGLGTPVSLTQQQFPGFGGATEMQPAGRRQRTPGNKIKRGRDGEVNGNVAPGYRGAAGGGNRRGGANAGNAGSAGNFGNAGNGANAGNGNANPAGAPRRNRRRRGGRGSADGAPRADGVAAGVATMPDIE